jgi:Icc protein
MNSIHPDSAADPTKAARRPIRLLQLTDCHLRAAPEETLLGVNTDMSLQLVLEDAKRSDDWPPDAVLATGDLVQDVCESSYVRLQHHLSSLNVPCYCLPGNHDDPELMRRVLMSAPNTRCQGEILFDTWQVICLDSTIAGKANGHLAAEELERLESSLVSQRDKYAVIALHHHPILSGSPWLDRMMLGNADAMFAVLQRHGRVRAVVYGHIHQAQDAMHRGWRILASPSTCFQFKPSSTQFALDSVPAGYRWLTLHPDGAIDTWVHRLNGLPEGLDLISGGY